MPELCEGTQGLQLTYQLPVLMAHHAQHHGRRNLIGDWRGLSNFLVTEAKRCLIDGIRYNKSWGPVSFRGLVIDS